MRVLRLIAVWALWLLAIPVLIVALFLSGCRKPEPVVVPEPAKHTPTQQEARAKFSAAMKACDKLRGTAAEECVDRAVDELDASR